MLNITFLDGYTVNPGDTTWDAFERLGNFTVYDRTTPDEVLARAAHADILIVNKTRLTADHFDALTRLRLVCVAATGYDSVDVAAAAAHGVTVCNAAGYSTESVAQMTLALLLETTNHVGQYAEANRQGYWSRSKDFCCWTTPLTCLAGKRLGIVGLGHIGLAVARLAQAFGMEVFAATSKSPDQLPPFVTPLPQDELFRRVDSYTTEDVERFYRTRCRPDMQAIVIVGDIDAAAVESKIRSLFQVMPRASGPAPEFPDSVVDAAGGEFFYFKDCEADCARITIDYPLAPVDVSLRTTAVPYIYEYITTLGVDILQSRLLAELEYAPFFAKSADVEIVPFLNRHSLQLSVECAPEDYVDAYVFLMRAVRSMQKYGVTAKEYEKGRSDFFFDLENTYSRRASLDNRYYTDLCVRNFTQGYAMAGIEYFKEYIETAGPMMDSTVVNSFMRAVFSDEDNRTVVCSSPEPAGGLEYFAVDPVPLREDSLYLSPESRRSGASFLASVQGSDKFVNTATGVTSRRLPNGATLAYRHMSVEPGWVYFEAVARGGISLSEDDVDLLRAYVDDVARISVNGGLNVFELSRLTNALHIEIDRSISVNGRKITGRFHTSCMDHFIELAVKYFEGSEPDIENFDKYRRMLEGCAPYASNSPEAVFGMLHSRDVRSGYGKELPADVPVSRIDYMSALKFVNMLFSNPAEFSFMFVGDFDETKLLASVYSHIASLPGGRRTAYSRQRKRTPFFIAAYDDVEVVPVPMEFPRRLNSCKLTFPCDMTIEDRVLSDITSKVIEREVIRRLSLRGILAEASRRYYSYPEEVVTIDFHFTTKDDVGDMEGMFAGIVMECAEKGVSENEVEAVKRNMDLKAKLREQTDYTYWTGVLRNRYIDRKDFYTRRQAAMDSVSVEDVNSALLDVLDDGRISVLSVVPEEK